MNRSISQMGMSLIEVMVAVSILSVISIGVMTLSKNMNKTSRTATKAFDMESAMREIQVYMNNKENCSATVLGARGNAVGITTILTGLKGINESGEVAPHPRLVVSTPSAPKYIGSGMIINGMFLQHVSNTTAGANYNLVVTFMKSVKANSSAQAASMTYGQNLTTRKIPLQLDNCTRYVASGNTLNAAGGQCEASGGSVVGASQSFFSDAPANANTAGIGDNTTFVGCQICPAPSLPASRTTVSGCL